MFIFTFERDGAQVGEGQTEMRHRSRLQALSCQRRARCGAQTHEPGDRDLNQSWSLNRLNHPGAPRDVL